MMPVLGPSPWDREQLQYSRDHRKHRRSSSSESYGYPHQEHGVDMRISGSGVPIWKEEYYRPYPVLNLYPYPHHPYHYPLPRWTPDFRNRPAPIGFEVWHEDYGKQGPRFYPEHGGNRFTEHGGNRFTEHGGNRLPEHGGNRFPEHGGNRFPEHGGNRFPEHGGNRFPEHGGNRFVHYRPNGRNLDDERLRVSRGKRHSRVITKKSKTSLNKKVTKSSFPVASGRQNDVGKQKSVDVLLACSSNARSKSSALCYLSQPCELLEKNDGLDTPVSSQPEEQYENNDGLTETVSSNVRSNPSASCDLSPFSSNVRSNPSASCDLSQPCELLEKNDCLDTPVSSQPEEHYENNDVLIETVSSNVRSNPYAPCDLSQPYELLEKNDGLDTPVSSQPEEQYENNDVLIETVSSNVHSKPSASCDLSQPCELLEKNDGLDTTVSSQPEEQYENNDVLIETVRSNVCSKPSASCDLSQPCELLEKNDGLDTPVSSRLEGQYENNDGLIETVSSNVHYNHSASCDLSQPCELLEKNYGLDTPASSQPEEQYENNDGLIETVSSNVRFNPSASCDLSQPYELLEKNDGLDTPVSSQPEEQCENNDGLNETVNSSHELEKSNSIDVNDWRTKWKPPGSLLSRSYCFRRTRNSMSIDDDCKKVKIDEQQGHGHDSDNLVADIHVPNNTETCTMPLEKKGPCKKRRLSWGEGLAKYEKKKIELTDNFVSENEMAVCSNNRGPSPVTEHKRLMDGSILDDNASVAYQYHLETPNYKLETADILWIACLNSAILDLPLSDDSSFVTSKLLALKGDVLKALELIESDIDKFECELKSLPQVEIIHDQSSSPVDCVLEYTHNENGDSQVTCQRTSLECIVQNETPHDVEAYSLGKRLFSDLENVYNAGGDNDDPFDISNDVEYKDMIKAKFLANKRFKQFKERVLAIKYRAFKHIWKEVHFLSKKEFCMKYQKKIDLSFPTPNGRYGKRCSSIHLRSARHKHLMGHVETINFIGKLISSNQVKPMRDTLKMPVLILDDNEKKATRFITTNGLIEDPKAVEKARSINFTWTEEQKEIFMDKLSIYGKDFTKIASILHKSTADCVEFYYKNHKADWFRRPPKKEKNQHVLEGNCTSFDNLYETTLINGNTDDGIKILQKDASEKVVDTMLYKDSRNGSRLLLKRSVGVDFDENESQTVGAAADADVLDGICGSVSPEGSISSCVTSVSDLDPGIGNHEGEIMSEMDYADWTDEEKCDFIRALSSYLGKDFETVSGCMKTRTGDQCKIFFSKVPKCAYEDCVVDSSGSYVFIKNSDIKTDRYISSPPQGPVPNTLEQNNVSFDLGFVDSKSSLGVSRKVEMPDLVLVVGNGRSHCELSVVRQNSIRLDSKKGNNVSSRNPCTFEHDLDAVNRTWGRISLFDGNAKGVISNERTRNGDISCKRQKKKKGSKSERLVLRSSENLRKNKLISQSDPSSVVVKPHHQRESIKLFTNPCSQQKPNQATRQHRNNENRPETKLGSTEIPQLCKFSFRDENKIQTGFKSYTVSSKIEEQLPLHEINSENRNSDGLSMIRTRKIHSTNRVFCYQMTNNREVQHFDIDKKQQPLPPSLEFVFPKKKRSKKQLRLDGRKKTKPVVEIQSGGYTKYHKR